MDTLVEQLSPDHRVHGLDGDTAAPDWPALREDEIQQVLARYPAAGHLHAVRWHSPRPLSAAALLETSTGQFLLKRHHQRVRDVEGLHEEHRFISHLAARGFPVARLIAADHGGTAVALGSWTYELFEKAHGDDLYRDAQSWTAPRSPDHAEAAGRTLARLHLAAEGFEAPARQPRVLVANLRLFSQENPLQALSDELPSRPALAAYLADQGDWRAALARDVLPWRAALGPLRWAPLWTHNDWHLSNLLWHADGQQVATVLDFGLSDRSFALHDLATAIERNGIGWLDLASTGDAPVRWPLIDALLRGYHAVRPLSPQDLVDLARLLPLSHTDFALGEVDYFAGIVGSRANADLAWHGYLLGHARWFTGHSGQQLLKAIAAWPQEHA